jgi:hypothetical protein
VAHYGLPIITVPTATRGILSERGLVTRDDPSLSALIGARAGVAGDILSAGEKGKVSDQATKSGTQREERHTPQIGETPLALPRGFGRRFLSSCRRP